LATFAKDNISPSISAENEAINGAAETNLGLYRAYLSLYLREAPFIAKQRLLIVRLLNTTPQGTPLNIYCFSADARLKAYEAITSTITEHAIAVLPLFNLKLSTLAHININKTQTQ
jgi:miniconductance mechanosensitive channel